MDYTIKTWNNRLPGEFNLDLLVTLYGTPSQPLTSDPLADGSTLAPTATPRRPPPPPPLRPWMNNDEDKEEEKEKEKEKDKEDDRRRYLQEDLEVSFDSEVANALENCKTARCVHVIDDEYTVVISKVMV